MEPASLISSLLIFFSLFNINDDYTLAHKYYTIGYEQHRNNNLSDALKNYLKAHHYMIKTDSVTRTIYLKNDIGIIFRSAGNPDAALHFYDQALDLNPDEFSEVMLKYNKSGALMDMGKYDEALELLNYCYLNTSEFNARKANIINKMGLILTEIGDYRNASEHFFILRNNARFLNKDSVKYLARAYHNLGNIYYQKKEWDKAKEYINLAIFNKPNNDQWKILSLVDYGEVSFYLGHYKDAVESLNMANALSDSLGADLTYEDIRIDKFLYRSYDSLGIDSMATAHLLSFERVVEQYNKNISNINIEDQRIRSQIVYDNFINELEERERMKYWYWIIGSGTLIFILIVILIVRREKNKRKETLLEISGIINSV